VDWGVKLQWVCRKQQFSVILITISPEAIFIIWYYFSLVAFPLTPKYVTLNNLEWPFYVKFVLSSSSSVFTYLLIRTAPRYLCTEKSHIYACRSTRQRPNLLKLTVCFSVPCDEFSFTDTLFTVSNCCLLCRS